MTRALVYLGAVSSVTIRNADDLIACQADDRVRKAYAYWRDIHPQGGLPGRPHIEPVRLGRLLPLVWLIDIQDEPFRLRYRLVGTEIVDLLGRDPTGQWFDEAHPDLATHASYVERAKAVIATRIPNWRKGRPNLWQHETYSVVQNLIMPLASDGASVDMLFNVSVASRK